MSLVYAVVLKLDGSEGLTPVLEGVAKWLRRKLRKPIPSHLLNGEISRSAGGVRLECWVANPGESQLRAIRLGHGDDLVSGRRWTTEIGIRQNSSGAAIQCSVVLTVDDVSTQVRAHIPLSPPNVVGHILTHAKAIPDTPGIRLRELTPSTAADIDTYEILDPHRRYAVVILSPARDGAYAISAIELRRLLVGLADVLLIPRGVDTRAIRQVMKSVPAPHRGAALIAFPPWRVSASDRVPWTMVRTDELVELRGDSPETEILRRITHRTNLPTSWQHIGPAVVRDALTRSEIRRLRQELSATVPQAAEYEKVLDQLAAEQDDLTRRFTVLEGERDEYWARAEEANEELRELKYKYANLELSLKSGDTKKAMAASVIDDEMRSIIVSLVSREPSLEESLYLMNGIYGRRLIILPSAWKSAADHDTFIYKREAFELLHTFATDYWERLAAGEPDSTARAVFAVKSFAAKENPTLSKEGRRARTFELDGASVFMEAHLKIQKGPNPAESLRLHFHWLAPERRLIIGHFGEHLPE